MFTRLAITAAWMLVTLVHPAYVRDWRAISAVEIGGPPSTVTKPRLSQTRIPRDWWSAWGRAVAVRPPSNFRVLVTPRQAHPILITCYHEPCPEVGKMWFTVGTN